MFPRDVEEFALMQFPIFFCYAVPPDMALPGVNGLDAQNLVLSHQLRQADPTAMQFFWYRLGVEMPNIMI